MLKLDESLLTQVPPFSRLTRDQIREILNLAVSKRFEEGSAIFQEGSEADKFFMLLDGYIRVVRITFSGEQVITLHIPSGQLFGIAKALGHTNYPATAIAAAECLTLSWPQTLWTEFVASYDGFATETYKKIGERISDMNNTIVEMATLHVEQRVASALLRLINQTGRKTEQGIEIDFPVTRQDISEMTGTTLHTVSRLLSAWQKDGTIESRRKHIVVTDPHQLVLISGPLSQN